MKLCPAHTLVDRMRFLILLGASVLSAAILFSSASAAAEELSDAAILEEAGRLYQGGRYNQAATEFQTLIERGVTNADIYYNLGNCFYHLERYGDAIVAYRRALRQRPDDPDAQANLSLARDKAPGNLSYPKTDPWYAPLLILNRIIPTSLLLIVFLLAYTCFWLTLPIRNTTRPKALRIVRIASGSIALLLALPCLAVAPGPTGEPELRLSHTTPAVITIKEAPVFAANDPNSQVVAVLREGAELQIVEHQPNWHRVLLPEGRTGWLQSPTLTPL